MPFLSEEEFDQLNKKIDNLEKSQARLNQVEDKYKAEIEETLEGNQVRINQIENKYEAEIKETKDKQKGLITTCVLLFLGLVISLLFGFVFTSKKAPVTKVEPQKSIIVRDTVYLEKEPIVTNNNINNTNSYYSVQLAVYGKFDAEFTSEVQKIYHNNLIYYVLGRFATNQEAENFRLILVDLKVKGAVVVKIEDGKLVD